MASSSTRSSAILRTRKRIKKRRTPATRIPDEIILYDILPRLPFKLLCRLKSLQRTWNQDISRNSFFAIRQSSHSNLSCPAIVSLKKNHLAFLPMLTGSPVGVPDPSLGFIGDEFTIREILASTNGLLLLHCSENSRGFLYLCNPATKEGTRIPKSVSSYNLRAESIGLAFGPSTGPDSYMLVHPIRTYVVGSINDIEYRFEVFSSHWGEWRESDQVVPVDSYRRRGIKPIYARGVLYWYCVDYLLWFNCDCKKSGHIIMPRKMSERFTRQEIGVHRDGVTCIQVSGESLVVWMLSNERSSGSSDWEKIHETSIERMIECNLDVFSSFWQTMILRSRKKISDGFTVRYQICPLPFECEERIFIRLIPNMLLDKNEKVLSYDMKTGKVDLVFTGQLFQDDLMAFGYNNSMVRLPVIH